MPLKAAIIPHLHSITPESKLTGAVNTVVKIPSSSGIQLVGTNTDYIGILSCLLTATIAQHPQSSSTSLKFGVKSISGAVIGGGATTRSAILALHRLGVGPIFLVNRDEVEVEATIDWFNGTELVEQGLELIHVRTPQEVDVHFEEKKGIGRLGIIVGAIPGESARNVLLWSDAHCLAVLPRTSAERMVYSTSTHLFILSNSLPLPPTPSSNSKFPYLTPPIKPIFMDMAYYPRPTPLTQIARALGWTTIDGMESMIEQGFAQQRMWKLGDASVEAGTRAGVLSEKTIREVREKMGKVEDVKTDKIEVDRADEV